MTSGTRSYLSSLAAKETDTLILGRDGADEGFIAQLGIHLEHHELVKVRFNEFKDEKRSIAEELERKTDSELVRIIGNSAIFFRQNSDLEKRKIEPPPSSSGVRLSSRRTADTTRKGT
jgi:RNA-binding protein